MIRSILLFIAFITAGNIFGQEGTSSPYSFYGLGLQKFKGTVENRSMGGLSMLSDSIHLNLQNPSAYGELKLTTFSVGADYDGLRLSNEAGESSYKDNASLDYLALGIPIGKLGVGFGVVPLNSVGYNVIDTQAGIEENRFSGSGGLNKVYLSSGFKVNENLNIGLELNYRFGSVENKYIFAQAGEEFRTRELTTSDLSGIGLSFGATYTTNINDRLHVVASVVSSPSFQLSANNTTELSTITLTNSNREFVIDNLEITDEQQKLDLPAELKVGLGIGEAKKWFVGAEYNYLDSQDFEGISSLDNSVLYDTGYQSKIGGYYIPDYRSLTSYFKRVVYRAGIRFEDSGLVIRNQDIKEFGMSFGVGLPIGNSFSNINLAFEYGQRGTTDLGLVKEDFFNILLSLSLNDQWFRKIKFN